MTLINNEEGDERMPTKMMAPIIDEQAGSSMKLGDASGPIQRSVKGSLGKEAFKGTQAQWTHEQEGLDFAGNIRCCCCFKMGKGIVLIVTYLFLMTVWDLFFIVFIIISKVTGDSS